MSERHIHDSEKLDVIDSSESTAEHVQGNHERELTSNEKEHGTEKHLVEAAATVERHATSKTESTLHDHEQSHHHPVFHGLREKEMAWTRSMTRTRKKLPVISRTFSKIAHNSVVDTSSEFIGKTVARPSSMLGGALSAFVGSSVVLWVSKHYGYDYNYLVFFLFFVAGAVIGLTIEGLWKAFRSK